MTSWHSSGHSNGLLVCDADGGNLTTVLESADQYFYYPDWSPDFDTQTPGFQGSLLYELRYGTFEEPINDVYFVDLVVDASGVTGQNVRKVLDDATMAVWSPRGDYVAYVDGNEEQGYYGIYLMDVQTGESTVVVPEYTGPLGFSQALGLPVGPMWPAWSPDGRSILFADYWVDPTVVVWEEEIIDPVTGEVVDVIPYYQDHVWTTVKEVVDLSGQVIDGPEIVVAPYAMPEPDWSDDGRYVAFGSEPVRVVDLGPGAPAPYDPLNPPVADAVPDTNIDAGHPTWPGSGSSELVFMQRPNGSGKRKIARRDLATQAEEILVEVTGYHLYEPDWRRFP
jgi:Tol biopolymer transport system component